MYPLLIDRELARQLVGKYALVSSQHAKTRALLYPSSGADVLEIAGGYAVFTEPGCPVSGAKGLGMNGPVTERDMDDLERFFADHDLTPDIDLCPFVDASLPHLLAKRGYGIVEFDNIYLRHLQCKNYATEVSPKIKITIAPSNMAMLWAESVAQGFADGGTVTESTRRIFITQYHIPQTICYLAWVNGEVVGAGMLNLLGDIATLSTSSTLPTYRGMGVQTALIETRLKAASDAGFQLATVMARPGSASERNIVRAGFQNAYTGVRMKKLPR